MLDGIATHAKDLLNAHLSALFLPEGDGKTFRAIAAVGAEAEQVRNDTINLGEGLLGDIAHKKIGEIVNDTNSDPRTILITGTEEVPDEHLLAVPLLANDELKGLMAVWRTGKGTEFIEAELEFLNGLARQAVIALQNAQLFAEVTETLEQQTATGEILQVIASSPTDIQPVLDVIAENAAKLLGGAFSNLYRTDGKFVYEAAQYNFPPEAVEEAKRSFPAPLIRDRLSSRTILDRAIIHLPDMPNQPDLPEVTRRYIKSLNMQCLVMVPLMREGEAIGSLGVGKHEPSPFTEKQIALLQTFASQAVIAIENVRLFNELQTRNREIIESLEQQTATSDILRVIASSPTDIQPVLEAVVQNAARLCDANDVQIYKVDGNVLRQVTHHGPIPALQDGETLPLVPGLITGRAVLEHRTIHIEDIQQLSETEFPDSIALQKRLGHRSTLATPLLREGNAIGAIVVRRNEVHAFTQKQISLLGTFADQAAIAIENVRLFNETEHLLKETEQHAAELAIINSVQQALAVQLDLQKLYELIGEKVRAIFDAQIATIVTYDLTTGMLHHQYYAKQGERLQIGALPLTDIARHLIYTRQPLLINANWLDELAAIGIQPKIIGGDQIPKAVLFAPLMTGDQVRGAISLQNVDRENAFSEFDVRLLHDPGQQSKCRPRKRAPL